ncbi:hypothetical protein [Lachnobacterium bovis]|uniref:hypothetical protein n=1 Tax=Lachnobacterium bovis TaxID=140626 RepID=UPI0003B6873A|nr:hypothetical protein [Lachnobacterium bovis]
MKKIFKRFCVGISVPVVTLCLSSLVFAWSSTTLNHGKAKWEGGESKKNVLYSRVIDLKKDGIRYHAIVWVKCDDGSYKYVEGDTNDVGLKGCIQAKKAASHKYPWSAEKTGYKNFKPF